MWPATLYGSIKRLNEAGLIEETDLRPAPEMGDARRRYYRLTPLGSRVLDAECERLFAQVFGGHANRDVGEQTDQAGGSVPFGNSAITSSPSCITRSWSAPFGRSNAW